MKWIGGTHTMRYHVHYHTQGLGNVVDSCRELGNFTDLAGLLVARLVAGVDAILGCLI